MHLILANQSVADLYDCPADLKTEAVVGAVVENCSIRLTYQLQNPETAKWLALMSGEILVDDEIRRVDRNSRGAELMHHGRTVRQASRQFVDVNMLRNLPARTAVLFGVGLPQFIQICPITTSKGYIPVYETPNGHSIDSNMPENCQKKLHLIGTLK
jgi:TraM recognition site of TraD and TraG